MRETSRDEVILEEMIRHGFWPREGRLAEDPADEIRRKGEIERELQQLRAQNRSLQNEAALLREMRKRRFAESRKKRQETKERREKQRQERAEAWQQKKAEEITFLGTGVSVGLSNKKSNEELLKKYNLPVYRSPEEIAAAMAVTISTLRFLAFSRKTSTVSHYIRFKIPKKTGGQRLISAPMPRLKEAQTWILATILEKIPVHQAAHGFRAGHSIVTNAEPHLGKEVILNVDLKDFFPSVSYRRVKGLFSSFGYSEAVATLFALLCTEPDIEKVELDGKTYYVTQTRRHLPQGAPTSPAITNLLCRNLDYKLYCFAEKLGFTYTRYADDLTFSASNEAVKKVGYILKKLEEIVKKEGFEVNQEKTRILRYSRQQEVTGVIVNEKLNVSRKVLRNFRATLYQIEKDGLEGKRWGQAQDLVAALQGFANYVYMVNPEQGSLLRTRVQAIIEKTKWKAAARPVKPSKMEEVATLQTESAVEEVEIEQKKQDKDYDSSKKWWKLW